MNSNMTSVAELAAVVAQLAQRLADKEYVTEVPAKRQIPEPVLLTVEEAAELLKIGKTTLYALVMSGDVESVQIGRLRRIHVDAVKAYASTLVANQNTAKQSVA